MIVAALCIVVAALALSAHRTTAGSRDQQGEHEAVVYEWSNPDDARIDAQAVIANDSLHH
jgi:hypothetical protein